MLADISRITLADINWIARFHGLHCPLIHRIVGDADCGQGHGI